MPLGSGNWNTNTRLPYKLLAREAQRLIKNCTTRYRVSSLSFLNRSKKVKFEICQFYKSKHFTVSLTVALCSGKSNTKARFSNYHTNLFLEKFNAQLSGPLTRANCNFRIDQNMSSWKLITRICFTTRRKVGHFEGYIGGRTSKEFLYQSN